MRRAGVAAAALLLPGVARAQQQDEQLWLQVNTNVPLADRVRITLEQIARFGDRAGGLFQTEFGGILGYRIAKGVELGLGYRKVGAHNGNTADDEDRFRQHLILSFGRFTGRFRVDERFATFGSEIGWRIRPLARYNHPIARGGWAAFVSHESFYLPNATRWGQRQGYERMRNIVGVTVPVAGKVAADIGYLNQYRVARGGSRAQMDHALSIQLTVNLSPRPAPRADD